MTRQQKPTRAQALRAWLQKPVEIPVRLLVTVALVLLALTLIVVGIALIYLPAGAIATGLALLAALTFDPTAARKVTWPR